MHSTVSNNHLKTKWLPCLCTAYHILREPFVTVPQLAPLSKSRVALSSAAKKIIHGFLTWREDVTEEESSNMGGKGVCLFERLMETLRALETSDKVTFAVLGVSKTHLKITMNSMWRLLLFICVVNVLNYDWVAMSYSYQQRTGSGGGRGRGSAYTSTIVFRSVHQEHL